MSQGSFVSAARNGVETHWMIACPPGQRGPLRPVIALHGKDGDAAAVMDLGVETALAQVAGAGYRPFAVVSVDGGNGYWHRRLSGQDSGAMVLTELLPLLGSMGFDMSRVGFIGWSMGGYGALRLGAMLGPRRTAGICAVSPALSNSYMGTDQGAFDNYQDWKNNQVFGLPALNAIPLRVDCGTGDRFYRATEEFVEQLRRPPAMTITSDGHDVAFWRAQLVSQLQWLAS